MWCGCLEPFAESVARWLGWSSMSIERRHVLRGMVATFSLAGAGCAHPTPAQKIWGSTLLDETISIDLHLVFVKEGTIIAATGGLVAGKVIR